MTGRRARNRQAAARWFARAWSPTWTDDYLVQLLGGANMEKVLAATPTPSFQPVPPISLDDVRVLPDGRVVAVVVAEGAEVTEAGVFVESDGRYLLNGNVALPTEATPVP